MHQLNHDDVERVRATITTLVSPFSHRSLAEWRDSARRAVADLTGAHLSGFVLPLEGTPLISCDNAMQAAADAWEREYRMLDTGYTHASRQRGLTIFGFAELYGDVTAFQRTPLYQEWHRPYRTFDALVLATSIPGTAMPTSINLFHEDERIVFGERGRLLLSLVEPAFRAGIEAVRCAGALRAGVGAHVDTLDAPACLFDASGEVVHENPAFAALTNAPANAGMRRFAASVARRMGALSRSPGRAGSDGRAVVTELSAKALRFRGEGAEWTLAPTLLPEPSCWGGPLVLVLARRDSGVPNDSTLRGRFGLTPREVDVARALAAGQATDAVARRLGLSIHTVRRHTEHIYAKLGVRSRSALTAFLFGASSHR